MPVKQFITFDNGERMPMVGFGTWQAREEELKSAVKIALEAGYRHFDTARAYENEAVLGEVLNEWIGDNPAKRKELFIVTKLPPGGMGKQLVQEYLTASLEDLKMDYVDMYLIHTPFGFKHVPGDLHPKNNDGTMMIDKTTDLLGVWGQVIKLKETGRVKHVGVSNMNAGQLARLTKVGKPECLQVELHVLCQQRGLVRAAEEAGVPIVAYSPLGSKTLAESMTELTGRDFPNMLTLPVVQKVAQAQNRTPAQILLRYNLQRGIAVIPKSTNPERIKQNYSVWDFELNDAQMKELAALDRGEEGRVCDFCFFPGVEDHPEFPFKK